MVIENKEELVLVVGSKVEVVCTSGGSRPPAVITWWIDSVRLGQYLGLMSLAKQRSKVPSEKLLNESFVRGKDWKI